MGCCKKLFKDYTKSVLFMGFLVSLLKLALCINSSKFPHRMDGIIVSIQAISSQLRVLCLALVFYSSRFQGETRYATLYWQNLSGHYIKCWKEQEYFHWINKPNGCISYWWPCAIIYTVKNLICSSTEISSRIFLDDPIQFYTWFSW